MNQLPTIKLPSERIGQLKAIGTALNLPSLADVAGYLIRSEIAKGTIPAGLPGIEVIRVADGVTITIDDNPATAFSKSGAQELADTIQRAVSGQPIRLMDLDSDFEVERRGNGVKVTVPFTGKARAFSRDVAEDLASLIRAAAE